MSKKPSKDEPGNGSGTLPPGSTGNHGGGLAAKGEALPVNPSVPMLNTVPGSSGEKNAPHGFESSNGKNRFSTLAMRGRRIGTHARRSRLGPLGHYATVKAAFIAGAIYRDGYEEDATTFTLPWRCTAQGCLIPKDGCLHVNLPGYPGPAACAPGGLATSNAALTSPNAAGPLEPPHGDAGPLGGASKIHR